MGVLNNNTDHTVHVEPSPVKVTQIVTTLPVTLDNLKDEEPISPSSTTSTTNSSSFHSTSGESNNGLLSPTSMSETTASASSNNCVMEGYMYSAGLVHVKSSVMRRKTSSNWDKLKLRFFRISKVNSSNSFFGDQEIDSGAFIMTYYRKHQDKEPLGIISLSELHQVEVCEENGLVYFYLQFGHKHRIRKRLGLEPLLEHVLICEKKCAEKWETHLLGPDGKGKGRFKDKVKSGFKAIGHVFTLGRLHMKYDRNSTNATPTSSFVDAKTLSLMNQKFKSSKTTKTTTTHAVVKNENKAVTAILNNSTSDISSANPTSSTSTKGLDINSSVMESTRWNSCREEFLSDVEASEVDNMAPIAAPPSSSPPIKAPSVLVADSSKKPETPSFNNITNGAKPTQQVEKKTPSKEQEPKNTPKKFTNINDLLSKTADQRAQYPLAKDEWKLCIEFWEQCQRDFAAPKMNGWKQGHKSDKLKIYKKMTEIGGETGVFMCADGVINAPPEVITCVLSDPKVRRSWEENFKVLDCISGSAAFGTQRTEMHTPIGFSNREVVRGRTVRTDAYPNVVYQRSTNECGKKPSNKKLVRAECAFSSDIMYPIKETSAELEKAKKEAKGAPLVDHPWKTRLIIAGNSSPGGLIPMWAVNMVIDKAPVKWYPKVQQACDKWMKERGISRTDPKMKEKLAKYVQDLSKSSV